MPAVGVGMGASAELPMYHHNHHMPAAGGGGGGMGGWGGLGGSGGAMGGVLVHELFGVGVKDGADETQMVAQPLDPRYFHQGHTLYQVEILNCQLYS